MRLYNGGEQAHRQRKFKPYVYFQIALNSIMTSVVYFTLSRFASMYRIEDNTDISSIAIYKHILSNDFTETVHIIRNDIEYLNKKIPYIVVADVKILDFIKTKTGIVEFLSQDGTEIQVRDGCRKSIHASSRGRKNKDGSPSKATIKVHTTFDNFCNLMSSSITSSAAKGKSEISQSCPWRYKDSCFTADRAHMSEEHFREIEKSCNYFIIRGKVNSSCKIECENEQHHNKPLKGGKTLSMIFPKRDDYYDCNIQMRRGYRCRAIKVARMKGRCKEYAVYFTNIPADMLSEQQIVDLYRLR